MLEKWVLDKFPKEEPNILKMGRADLEDAVIDFRASSSLASILLNVSSPYSSMGSTSVLTARQPEHTLQVVDESRGILQGLEHLSPPCLGRKTLLIKQDIFK